MLRGCLSTAGPSTSPRNPVNDDALNNLLGKEHPIRCVRADAALGLEVAGFRHRALVELDSHSVKTLRLNRPEWHVIEADLHAWDPSECKGADLVAAGLPCPPFQRLADSLVRTTSEIFFPGHSI